MTENRDITFESLKLIPGQPLQLEFEGYDENRDRSSLVGYQRGRSVLVATPTKQGVAMSIKPKTAVKVRLFVNQINGACAFQTTVQHVSVLPFPHLHLSWPETLVVGEVRKSIRAKVHLICSAMLTIEGRRKTLSAVVDDLSTNGARIHSQKLDVSEGDEMDLVFKITVSGVERILHLKSVIRTRQYHEGKDIWFYGLQFMDVDEADTITLHAFVLTQLHTGG